jgi:hypothetical protein
MNVHRMKIFNPERQGLYIYRALADKGEASFYYIFTTLFGRRQHNIAGTKYVWKLIQESIVEWLVKETGANSTGERPLYLVLAPSQKECR